MGDLAMFCKNCGNEISESSRFCSFCGIQLESTEESSQTHVEENVSPKSRLAALLFGIFLGGIGIHNFYLGHTKRGIAKILMLVFGVIFYIASILKIASGAYNYSHSYSYMRNSVVSFSLLVICGIILVFIPGIWAFIEWVLIACGKAKDSKGLPVTKWE